ncbi:hypothetical protein EYF80_025813 [Liparis tanakae]|uniref:Uncharacterized protein n=1 Tax=Liparis tanakae TaxID=230148 RepID=A0A4Z2HEC9_9TELE|nr:hypothetical protein EYF80_025813 [Liparis tanakae]
MKNWRQEKMGGVNAAVEFIHIEKRYKCHLANGIFIKPARARHMDEIKWEDGQGRASRSGFGIDGTRDASKPLAAPPRSLAGYLS